jgi:ribonucleoside-diphosphate reductase alpha chain
MKTDRTWHGVRLRQTEAGSDPDAPLRTVRLPAAWEDAAAAALCDLAPGTGRITLPCLAQSWVTPLSARAKDAGLPELGDQLHALLLLRRGAPSAGVWQGALLEAPGFVLNLPAFHDATTGFDVAAFAEAVVTAAEAMRLAAPGAGRYAIAMADLAGLLALLGLDYAGQPARDVAACLAAILRGRADATLAGPQPDLLAAIPAWPAPPDTCVVRGLAAAAAEARALALRCGGSIAGTAILPPGPVEALLGVETGGIAPAFGPVGPGGLTRSARAWLAARGIPLDTALAASLAGEPVFPVIRLADHVAMHDAVAPMLHAMPARPAATPHPTTGDVRREELPARRRGFTQKAAIGGHRIFVRTGEYADGRLGEIGIALPRESATVRGLADSFAAAVSLGLQHGVPLDSFVDAFTHLRFAPSGAVESDPAVDRAASIPDYVFRSLAASYLGRSVAPDDFQEDPMPAEPAPLLPLDLPRGARRRPALRLVAN